MKPDNTLIFLVAAIPHAVSWIFGHAVLDLKMTNNTTMQKIGIGIIIAIIIAQAVVIHGLIYG